MIRMKKQLLLIIGAGLLAIGLLMTGCDFKEKKKERITAAGHPDEMKDSTRLDPNPVYDPNSIDHDSSLKSSDTLNPN